MEGVPSCWHDLGVCRDQGSLFMLHRDPSIIDFGSNVLGAMLGSLLSARWNLRPPAFRITRTGALLAILLALSLVISVRISTGDPINARGDTSQGTLEAYWKLDESLGRAVMDYSGHGLLGQFHREPTRTAAAVGTAPFFDGANYIDFGTSTALRLAGSTTISVWISSSSFPVDDAAVVSQLQQSRGYQLDTTVDRGPRTLGFKLTDSCGKLMARYGATPLSLNTWYHVAGVYDAERRTLDVYLDGEFDNGFLRGSVTASSGVLARPSTSAGGRTRRDSISRDSSMVCEFTRLHLRNRRSRRTCVVKSLKRP